MEHTPNQKSVSGTEVAGNTRTATFNIRAVDVIVSFVILKKFVSSVNPIFARSSYSSALWAEGYRCMHHPKKGKENGARGFDWSAYRPPGLSKK